LLLNEPAVLIHYQMHPSVNVTSTEDDPAIFANTEEELLPWLILYLCRGGLLEDELDEIFAVTESIALAEQNQPSIEKDGFLEDKLDKEVAVVSENLHSITVTEQREPFTEKDGLMENEVDKEVAAVTENSQSIANEKYHGVANVALNEVTTFAVGQVSSKHSSQAQYFKKIRRPPALFAKETDESVIARRAKDIQKGYNCEAYKYYVNAVPKYFVARLEISKLKFKHERIKGVHPVTPTKELKFSRRSWDAQIRLWRKNIHTAVHHQVIDEQPNFEKKGSDFYGGKLICKGKN
ncbi:Oocyte-specific histone RNA stem-loop-binding protein 2, partial [Trichinella zimbabwensis]